MNYYDDIQKHHERGIDYDLWACLHYNPQDGFTVEDIDRVLAVWEGENDDDWWRWVLRLKDGRVVFLQGGCDYTGWDCISSAWSEFADTPEEAAQMANDDVYDNAEAIVANLLLQLRRGKAQTWSEGKDEEFGLVPPQDGD